MKEVGPNEHQDEIELQGIFPPSIKNKIARVICVSAVGIEPFYSAFVWQSLREAAEKAIEMFGGTVNDTVKDYIFYIAIPFAAVNLISDLTSVDPLRDADALTAPSQKEEEYTEFSKRALGFFIKVLAVTASFPVGGLANTLPLKTFSEKFIQGSGGNIFFYGSTAVIVPLTVLYYMMFNNPKIQKHANEFVDTAKNPVEFFQNLYQNSSKYLEVWLQSLSNAVYRGVIFGYILMQSGKVILKVDKNNPYLLAFIILTGLSTFGVTLFSRFLSTRDRFLNPAFNSLTQEELDEAPRLRKALIYDGILSLTRGGGAAVFLSQVISKASIFKYGAPLLVGVILAAHSFYVRYQAGYYQEALKSQRINIANKAEADKNAVERANLLAFKSSTVRDPIKNAPQLFDQIAASHASPGLDWVIDSINVTARFTKFIAFFLFLDVFNWIFPENKLSLMGASALVFLLGAEVFKNDCDMYRGALQDSWQGFAAKWQLEKENGDTASCSCFSGSFFRPAKVAFKSLYDYPYKLLVEEVAQSPESTSNLQYIQ